MEKTPPKGPPLTEAQKELIRLLAQAAAREFMEQTNNEAARAHARGERMNAQAPKDPAMNKLQGQEAGECMQ